MKRYLLLIALGFVLCSHDMYLKLDSYFLDPDSEASIMLYNGTFERSDNVIDRNRMADVSLVGNGSRTRQDTARWTEDGDVTILNIMTGEPGTWVAGVSTRPRTIEMEAEAFNDYLEHDGVLDMLKRRKETGALDEPAVEKYSKHVKAIFQVGEKLTSDWQTVLGYPVEFVPMENPYDLHPGHPLKLKLYANGEPLANQLVYVGSNHDGHTHAHEDGHTHDHGDESGHSHEDDDHHHHELKQYRTDADGSFSFDITHEGVWYVRTIHMTESAEEGLTHESNWATLTFEVGAGHSHDHLHAHDGEHSHGHDDEGGIPGYVYWMGSLALVALLFLFFNKKSK